MANHTISYADVKNYTDISRELLSIPHLDIVLSALVKRATGIYKLISPMQFCQNLTKEGFKMNFISYCAITIHSRLLKALNDFINQAPKKIFT